MSAFFLLVKAELQSWLLASRSQLQILLILQGSNEKPRAGTLFTKFSVKCYNPNCLECLKSAWELVCIVVFLQLVNFGSKLICLEILCFVPVFLCLVPNDRAISEQCCQRNLQCWFSMWGSWIINSAVLVIFRTLTNYFFLNLACFLFCILHCIGWYLLHTCFGYRVLRLQKLT